MHRSTHTVSTSPCCTHDNCWHGTFRNRLIVNHVGGLIFENTCISTYMNIQTFQVNLYLDLVARSLVKPFVAGRNNSHTFVTSKFLIDQSPLLPNTVQKRLQEDYYALRRQQCRTFVTQGVHRTCFQNRPQKR